VIRHRKCTGPQYVINSYLVQGNAGRIYSVHPYCNHCSPRMRTAVETITVTEDSDALSSSRPQTASHRLRNALRRYRVTRNLFAQPILHIVTRPTTGMSRSALLTALAPQRANQWNSMAHGLSGVTNVQRVTKCTSTKEPEISLLFLQKHTSGAFPQSRSTCSMFTLMLPCAYVSEHFAFPNVLRALAIFFACIFTVPKTFARIQAGLAD
jgi:hypothetical protein